MSDNYENRIIEYDKKIKELKQRLFRDIAIAITGFFIAAGSLFVTTGLFQQVLITIGIFLMIMPVTIKVFGGEKCG
jgi:hypothetical protein